MYDDPNALLPPVDDEGDSDPARPIDMIVAVVWLLAGVLCVMFWGGLTWFVWALLSGCR